jgi:hypothetical protein
MTDTLIRRALWASVPYNAGGALLFLFPASLGQLAGLPGPVPHVYTASLAVLVALFAGAYAWLARQPQIDRPMVALCALGKAGFFTTLLVCGLLGEAPGRGVVAALGDLGLAVVFAWWLLGDRAAPIRRAAPVDISHGPSRRHGRG